MPTNETYKLTPVSVAKELPKEAGAYHTDWGYHWFDGKSQWSLGKIDVTKNVTEWFRKEPDRTSELMEVLEKVKERIKKWGNNAGYTGNECVCDIETILEENKLLTAQK